MPVLDLYNLKEFNSDLISQILSIYLIDGKLDIEELKQAHKDKNFDLASKKAHKLTGSSKTVGAINVAEIAEELEVLYKSNSNQNDLLVKKLEELFEEVKEHIEKNELIS